MRAAPEIVACTVPGWMHDADLGGTFFRHRSRVDATDPEEQPCLRRWIEDAPGTVEAITRLLDLARESGMRVVFSQDTHDPGDPEFEIWPAHALRGTWGWEMIDELAPREGELVVQKVRYDAFYATELDHMLGLWNVKTILLCGTVANICVHYTAASAALRWLEVVIPRDATSALDPFDLEASLRQTSFLFAGRITSSESIKVTS